MLLALLALLAAGCGSYRRVAPLDESQRGELSALRTSLGSVTIRVARSPLDPWFADRAVAALSETGFHAVDAERGERGPIISIESVDAGFGMSDAWPDWTFGIIPAYDSRSLTYRLRIDDGRGRSTSATYDESAPCVVGWLGLPLGLLSGWSTFFSPYGPPLPNHYDDLALRIGRSVDSFLRAK